jgi:Polysaccharide pyruvyl transferase
MPTTTVVAAASSSEQQQQQQQQQQLRRNKQTTTTSTASTTTTSTLRRWTARARLYAILLACAFVAYTYSHAHVMQYFNQSSDDYSVHSLLLQPWFDHDVVLISNSTSSAPTTSKRTSKTTSSSSSGVLRVPILAAGGKKTSSKIVSPKSKTTPAILKRTVMPTFIVNSKNETIPPPPPPPPPPLLLLDQVEQKKRTRVVWPHVSTTATTTTITDLLLTNKDDDTAPPPLQQQQQQQQPLVADWLYDGPTGSYWLPRPPSHPMGGYELREDNSNSSSSNKNFKVYGNRTGFVAKDHVNIVMYDGVWYHDNFEGYNAGDFIAYFLSPLIAGRMPFMTGMMDGHIRSAARGGLAVVGSILHFGPRYSWGPGLIQHPQPLKATTETIFAMRGPKSYRDMVRQRPPPIRIPNIVGDIGSFMSWFYQPHNQVQRYELCIIPHYVDKNAPFIAKLKKIMNSSNDDLAILDITAPVTRLMDDIVKCRFILSSSLHGIIFSDSYGIPNAHVELSGKVFGKGHKFDDYYESVHRTTTPRHVLNGRADKNGKLEKDASDMTLLQLQTWIQRQYDLYREQPPHLDHLRAFWNACPMHAVAYHNQTRVNQVWFAQKWAHNFDYYMQNRPANMLQLEVAMNRALNNVSSSHSHVLSLEFDPRPAGRRFRRRFRQ